MDNKKGICILTLMRFNKDGMRGFLGLAICRPLQGDTG